VIGSALGGYIVYHGGAGIEAALMKPGMHEHEDHSHQGEHPSPASYSPDD
jgi:hypothetical protein